MVLSRRKVKVLCGVLGVMNCGMKVRKNNVIFGFSMFVRKFWVKILCSGSGVIVGIGVVVLVLCCVSSIVRLM